MCNSSAGRKGARHAQYLHYSSMIRHLGKSQKEPEVHKLQEGTTGVVQELRSCVKVEMAVLGSPSLIVRTVSVDVKQR